MRAEALSAATPPRMEGIDVVGGRGRCCAAGPLWLKSLLAMVSQEYSPNACKEHGN